MKAQQAAYSVVGVDESVRFEHATSTTHMSYKYKYTIIYLDTSRSGAQT